MLLEYYAVIIRCNSCIHNEIMKYNDQWDVAYTILLQVIFTQYEYTSESAIPPNALRSALATCFKVELCNYVLCVFV